MLKRAKIEQALSKRYYTLTEAAENLELLESAKTTNKKQVAIKIDYLKKKIINKEISIGLKLNDKIYIEKKTIEQLNKKHKERINYFRDCKKKALVKLVKESHDIQNLDLEKLELYEDLGIKQPGLGEADVSLACHVGLKDTLND